MLFTFFRYADTQSDESGKEYEYHVGICADAVLDSSYAGVGVVQIPKTIPKPSEPKPTVYQLGQYSKARIMGGSKYIKL
jgi:hypothetical protein